MDKLKCKNEFIYLSFNIIIKSLSYNEDDVTLVGKYNHHKKSCRTINFSDDGQCLFFIERLKKLTII